MKVLIVDDDPDIAELLQVIVRRRGHATVVCADAESAWQRCQEELFPLILLDRGLPGMDGRELCRRLRAQPRGGEPVVVMITAGLEPEELAQVLAEGADDYVAKPFTARILDVRLTVAERQAAARAEQRRSEEARRESEARFRSAFDDAAIGMALVGPDGRFLQVNQALCELLGYAEVDLLTQTLQELGCADEPEPAPIDPEGLLARGGKRVLLETRLRHQRGDPIWVFLIASLVRDEWGAPRYFVCQVHDVTEQKVLEQQLRHLAHRDPLTGLPNRTSFLERLEQALTRGVRRGQPVAVIFLDLDGFKPINDRLGHDAGDQLLVEVAGRLQASVRPDDTAARLGGDEFTVLLEGINDPDDAAVVAERILRALRRPVVIRGQETSVAASVGIAVGQPGQTLAADLLREADVALYEAKAAGKGRAVLFTPGMGARVA